jgi:hypothetical protein
MEYVYYNFDNLDREIRSNTKDLPSVMKGGNKELLSCVLRAEIYLHVVCFSLKFPSHSLMFYWYDNKGEIVSLP